jgi:hypothetical protein
VVVIIIISSFSKRDRLIRNYDSTALISVEKYIVAAFNTECCWTQDKDRRYQNLRFVYAHSNPAIDTLDVATEPQLLNLSIVKMREEY